jgi:hypothetical protein
MNQPNAMLTFGLLPDRQIVSIYTDDDGNLIDPPGGQLIPLVKLTMPETGSWAPVLVWFDDRVERRWEEAPPLPPPPSAPPQPDWDRFQSQLQTTNGFPDAWSAIFTGDARPGISLIASLAVWQATGQWTQFLVAAGACLALLSPQQASHVGLELLALAHDCNLDPAFCEALEAMLDQGAL